MRLSCRPSSVLVYRRLEILGLRLELLDSFQQHIPLDAQAILFGIHRTGIIAGIIRKKQGIREGLILSEYFRHTRDKDGLQASHVRNTVFLVKFYRQGMSLIDDLEFPPPPDPTHKAREGQAGP